MNALYWAEVVEGRRRGAAASCIRAALTPPSLAYRLAVAARNAAYDRGLLRPRRLPRPVVSVGNLAAGGTGKTPLVKLLAAGLRARGLKPAVLSRGYGASPGGPPFPRLVSDGSRLLLPPGEAGDEAFMLAAALPGVPVAVSPDRAGAGEMVARSLPVDLFILDDGFQHRRLARDADILLLDSARPFGSGRLLPAGALREPPSAAGRAGSIVLTRCEGPPVPAVLALLSALNPGAPVFTAAHEPVRLAGAWGWPDAPLESLRGKTVAAFCGIASPGDFARTLSRLGARVARWRPYPDHHPYRAGEIERLARAAAADGASALVTTSKDAARLPGPSALPIPLLALEIEMRFCGGEAQLLQWVVDSIGAPAAAPPSRTGSP